MDNTISPRAGRPAADSAPRRDVADLRDVALRPSVEGAVAAVRDFLGMDIAYASEFVDGKARVVEVDGDGFELRNGGEMPLEHTYCQRVLDGRLPNLMPDVRGATARPRCPSRSCTTSERSSRSR
jgi:hypothetical protein